MLWHIWACRPVRLILAAHHSNVNGVRGRVVRRRLRECEDCDVRRRMSDMRLYVHVSQHFVLYFCHCGVCHATEDSLRRHRNQGHCRIGFCTRCGECFPSVGALRAHRREVRCEEIKILDREVKREVFVVGPCAYNSFLAWFSERFWEPRGFPERFPLSRLKAITGPRARACARGIANEIDNQIRENAK
jgi:hypothetical protein